MRSIAALARCALSLRCGRAAVGRRRRLPATRTYDGRSGSLDVEPPRIDQSIEIDGNLDEAVWSQAAVLAGFSRYAPVDGAPADHATDVLVWYSPTAMHFGIRASAPAGIGARHARRSRSHPVRRSRHHLPQHLQRRPPGAGVRRQPARRPARWRASPKARAARRRLHRPQPAARRRISAPTSSSSRRAASPRAATKSRCASRSRACAINRSRSRTGASTSPASSRSRASKTAGRRPSATRRRSSRSRAASRTSPICAAGSCSI